jgi:molecular chaperone DnaK
MTNHRPLRIEFGNKVRIRVAGESDLVERYAQNLGAGGMFIQYDQPPPVGTRLLIEFVLPDDSVLCRVEGKVVHSKHADNPGDVTAGIGLEFVQLDERARLLAAHKQAPTSAPPAPISLEEILSETGDSVLGIDLGTTNSCVAIVENGTPRVLASAAGYDTVPSVVFISPEAEKRKVLTGHKAVERMILDPQRAIYGAKRFIGRPFTSKEVKTFGHFFHYELSEGSGGRAAVRIDGRPLPLEWVSGCILAHMKHMAHKALGRAVTKAVITVPAYFGEGQRQSVRDAGKLAGLEVVRIVSEPTAAAVAFGFGRGMKKTILVYDLGGGTFDASILKLDGDKMTVLAADGDAFLGGSDFDDRITELLLAHLERTHGVNLRTDRVCVQRVRFAAELAKKQLSQAKLTRIDVPYLAQGPNGPINLATTLEVEQLQALTDDLVTRTLDIVENTLQRAKLKSSEIDEVVLVGGQSRSPYVAERIFERFGKKPSRTVHPDHAVALGAAIVGAAAYAKQDAPKLALTDVLPASVRLALQNGKTRVLMKRGDALPATVNVEVESLSVGGGKANEYLALLCRGEAEDTADNEVIGSVRVPSSFALAVSKTKAPLTLSVNAEGLLKATLKHPLNDELQTLDVELKPGQAKEEMMTIDDNDIVAIV